MNFDDVLNINIENKNVLIIGVPGSGKTTLCDKFEAPHCKIHTDTYMEHGYEQSLYVLLEDLKEIKPPTIIEGVQGYRLLRKGVQLDCYYPDIVIELIISEEQMLRVYKNERDEKKVKYLNGFNKMHQKIINDYFALENPKNPEWLKVFNDNI